jgi:pyruvate/2-oxoglutarate dehydrogenase complex dihydrolipoamide dehydrogenase (E3) component
VLDLVGAARSLPVLHDCSEDVMRCDLAVIGSGAAGFEAAITARGSGRSVVMIERGTVGGTCVNTGCVPSKALQMAELWLPYLTMAEALKLAAQAFTRDISRLSCCAA